MAMAREMMMMKSMTSLGLGDFAIVDILHLAIAKMMDLVAIIAMKTIYESDFQRGVYTQWSRL